MKHLMSVEVGEDGVDDDELGGDACDTKKGMGRELLVMLDNQLRGRQEVSAIAPRSRKPGRCAWRRGRGGTGSSNIEKES